MCVREKERCFIFLFKDSVLRERGRHNKVTKMFEERREFYSLVLVDQNKKLAIQNGLWRTTNTHRNIKTIALYHSSLIVIN